jgi:hypothetical protein
LAAVKAEAQTVSPGRGRVRGRLTALVGIGYFFAWIARKTAFVPLTGY